jgi:hypothetical protein
MDPVDDTAEDIPGALLPMNLLSSPTIESLSVPDHGAGRVYGRTSPVGTLCEVLVESYI